MALEVLPGLVISARCAGRQAIKLMKQETSNLQFFDMDDELEADTAEMIFERVKNSEEFLDWCRFHSDRRRFHCNR